MYSKNFIILHNKLPSGEVLLEYSGIPSSTIQEGLTGVPVIIINPNEFVKIPLSQHRGVEKCKLLNAQTHEVLYDGFIPTDTTISIDEEGVHCGKCNLPGCYSGVTSGNGVTQTVYGRILLGLLIMLFIERGKSSRN